MINTHASAKNIVTENSWSSSTCICENGKYLKSITDTSVIVFDEIINGADSVSKTVTNTISRDVTSTMSIISADEKVR